MVAIKQKLTLTAVITIKALKASFKVRISLTRTPHTVVAKQTKNTVLITASKDRIGATENKTFGSHKQKAPKIIRPIGVLICCKIYPPSRPHGCKHNRQTNETKNKTPNTARPNAREGIESPKDIANALAVKDSCCKFEEFDSVCITTLIQRKLTVDGIILFPNSRKTDFPENYNPRMINPIS